VRSAHYGQYCFGKHALTGEPIKGAQQPELHCELSVHSTPQSAPLVNAIQIGVALLTPRQQSVDSVQEVAVAAHVLVQKPRGAQLINVESGSGAQQPDSHSAPEVHAAAHSAGWVGSDTSLWQIPEQHAFGVLVQIVPTARHVPETPEFAPAVAPEPELAPPPEPECVPEPELAAGLFPLDIAAQSHVPYPEPVASQA
jgi:hypothetical protein